MKFSKVAFLFIVLRLSMTSYGQEHKKDCSILKNCKLRFADMTDPTAYMEIKDSEIIEYSDNKKYYIKSKIKWTSDCEYDATMVEITVPNFPFQPGELMHVTIDRMENNMIYYTATIRGEKLDGVFELVTNIR